MSQPANDYRAEARQIALSMGGAGAALTHLTRQGCEMPLWSAVKALAELESGTALADLDYICGDGNVHPAWLERREATRRAADQWRRELTVHKASLYMTGMAA